MTMTLNKKNKAHIFDMINKYFKLDHGYVFIFITGKYTESYYMKIKYIHISLSEDCINAFLCGTDKKAVIRLQFRFNNKIEFKGTSLNLLNSSNNKYIHEEVKIKKLTDFATMIRGDDTFIFYK